MFADARGRLLTVLVCVGLAAGLSSCAATTSGSAVGGFTSAPDRATNRTSSNTGTISTPPSVTSAPSTSRVVAPSPSTSKSASPAPSSPSGSQVTNKPGIFVGVWNGHGRQLAVTADGSATVDYRVYKWCSDDPRPPCDLMKGNMIYQGGHIRLHIVRVVTARHMSTATATVLTSTDPQIRPGSKQTFVLKGDVVTSTNLGLFCDEKASMAGTCGA